MNKNLTVSFLVLLSALECGDIFCFDAFAGFTADNPNQLRFNLAPAFLQMPRSMTEKKRNIGVLPKSGDVNNSYYQEVSERKLNRNMSAVLNQKKFDKMSNGDTGVVLKKTRCNVVEDDFVNSGEISEKGIKIDLNLIDNVTLKSVSNLSWNFAASSPKNSFKDQYVVEYKIVNSSLYKNNANDLHVLSPKSYNKFVLESESGRRDGHINKYDTTIYAPNIPVNNEVQNLSLSVDDITNRAKIKKDDTEKLLIDVDKELNKAPDN